MFTINYMKSYATRLLAALPAPIVLWIDLPINTILAVKPVLNFGLVQTYMLLAGMLVILASFFAGKAPESQLNFARVGIFKLIESNLFAVVLAAPYLIFTIGDLSFFTLSNTLKLFTMPIAVFFAMIAQHWIICEGLDLLEHSKSNAKQ